MDCQSVKVLTQVMRIGRMLVVDEGNLPRSPLKILKAKMLVSMQIPMA